MKYFLVTIFGFICGIFLSAFSLSATLLFFFLLLSIILFLNAKFFEIGRVKILGYFIATLCLGIFLGLFRVALFDHFVRYDLRSFENQKMDFVGEIISDPVSNGVTQKFTVQTSAPAVGKILVNADLFPAYHYGDDISIYGTIHSPQIIDEGDTRIFDYPAYLLKDGITETLSFGSIKIVGAKQGNILVKFLYDLRHDFVSSMQRVLPEPTAGLLAGIVLGTQTLGNDLNSDFRAAGLSHIVVLSGYNITIVAESVMSVCLAISVAAAPFAAVIAVILFVIMSGLGTSAIRAGIMALVALLGKRYGKSYDAGRALFFAAFVMVLYNPLTLISDPSFHLSFLATFAMIYLSDFTLEKLSFITRLFGGQAERFGLREILSTTLAVNIFVLPYILFMSGNISLYAIPANLLVLPLVPLTMFLGLFVSLAGFAPGIFGRFLGFIPGLPAYIILKWDIFIAQTASHLPFAQIGIKNFSLVWLMIVYAVYGLLYYYFVYKKQHPTPVTTSDGFEVVGE